MKKQCSGNITLFDSHDTCMESRQYSSFEERIGIINHWKKTFRLVKDYFYQIEPETDDTILSIEPTSKRGRILLNQLNKAG